MLIPLAQHERRTRELEKRIEELEQEITRLQEENGHLREALESARRSGKRQAAPFSKGAPKPHPKKPGRKSGKEYGPKAHRPPPDHVDEVVDVPVPSVCPFCGGSVEEGEELNCQFQADVPEVKPRVTRFDIRSGRCKGCRRRVRGRDPRQNSDALGAAGSHLGPRALALAAQFHAELGLSYGKLSLVFETLFGLKVTRGGLAQAVARTGRALEPTYQALIEALPRADVISPDETGWRVGGVSCWLWVFVAEEIVVYGVLSGRGFDDATTILPADYAGTLCRDGWAAYRGYENASHDSCKNHLLRRCRELLETADRGAARVPNAVKRILKGGLQLRDRRDRDQISARGLAIARGKLEAKMDRLLTWKPKHNENRKLLNHLAQERNALFTFLDRRGIPATNHLAEQGIRPAVVNRKVSGGNRTWMGAAAHERLISFIVTARRQRKDPTELLTPVLTSPDPRLAALRGIGPAPPP